MVLAVFRSRALHEGLKRFPERATYRVLHPDLKGYWQFFGRVDGAESWFFHAPVPAGTTRDNYDFHRPVAERGRVRLRLRVRPCRLLGPARRGRGRLSGRPRVHRRRRRPQPPALWRVRPQQRARGRGQSRLETGGAPRGLGRRRPVAVLQRRAPARVQGNRRTFHRGPHRRRARIPGTPSPRPATGKRSRRRGRNWKGAAAFP